MDDLDRFIASLPLNRQKQIAERVQKLVAKNQQSGGCYQPVYDGKVIRPTPPSAE